jgi:DNA-binding phage protein
MIAMVLPNDVKNTIRARLQSDYAFRFALLSEAVEALLSNDLLTAKSVLWDYIDATIGFADLSSQTGLPEKSLMWMFSENGNPRATSLFKVLAVLQQPQGIHLAVDAAA